MALSSGPSVEFTMNRYLTSAGRPQRTPVFSSKSAGQSRNIIRLLIQLRLPPLFLAGRNKLASPLE